MDRTYSKPSPSEGDPKPQWSDIQETKGPVRTCVHVTVKNVVEGRVEVVCILCVCVTKHRCISLVVDSAKNWGLLR